MYIRIVYKKIWFEATFFEVGINAFKKKKTKKKTKNKRLKNYSLIGFNGMSINQELFCAKNFDIHVHCLFIFTVLSGCFFNDLGYNPIE